MAEVAFHFNVPDKLAYACRLLRKAAAGGARVAVTGPREVLQRLDSQLWTFSQLDFVPHVLLPAEARLVAASPVVLSEDATKAPHRQVLLNLGDAVPPGFEGFERLIEIVSLDAADRQAARGRWKQYAGGQHPLIRHDLAQPAPS